MTLSLTQNYEARMTVYPLAAVNRQQPLLRCNLNEGNEASMPLTPVTKTLMCDWLSHSGPLSLQLEIGK